MPEVKPSGAALKSFIRGNILHCCSSVTNPVTTQHLGMVVFFEDEETVASRGDIPAEILRGVTDLGFCTVELNR